ncbi:hypothetical protein BDEG_22624 [Batrachochytrium dendrobatidis JEL423]|uniref:T-cell immunomodulatory protein TIP C2 domain-containing protein n=1 Tax=Batrachochytrium dendrobatidis (strain JEL423) TaxID=403673 RepID=A0A177WF28_BATDL|nr:hypothetical protein BDEG_22624 [Batrachochytrium dendrobatidis JEL423]
MPKFPTPGLHSFDAGLAEANGRIAAFGDFNGDRILASILNISNIIVLNALGQTKFVRLPTTKFSILQNGKPLSITNVIPGDFNYDGKLDFILFGQKDPLSTSDKELHFQLFLGNGKLNSTVVKSGSGISETAQPFVIDYDGQMYPSLLGHVHNQPNNLSLWTFNTTTNLFDIRPSNFTQNSPAGNSCQLSHPHSSAFIDINGDCLPDMRSINVSKTPIVYCNDADVFLTCDKGSGRQGYQIWINSKENGFEFARSGDLPVGSGQISFADMDADGTIDMVFPVCNSGSCTINIAYNQQIGLCVGDILDNCRDPHNLCVADPDFKFSFASTSPRYVSMPIAELFPLEDIYLNDLSFKGTMPIPLRIGDYNNDGYPDILFLSVSKTSASKISSRLVRSVPCDNRCTPEASAAGARSFVSVYEGVGVFKSYPDMILSGLTFMDIDEDGTLDIFMTVRNIDMGMRTISLINNYYNDAFFLKAIVLNGVCNEWCPGLEPFPDPRPYGVNYAGGTFKYTVLDTRGERRATQVAQLPQSAYMSLHTPYTLFGLGRTNNYIEDLFVGVSRRTKEHVAAYQGVIPNSQLVIIPYEAARSGHSPVDWKLELYMNPSSSSAGLMGVLCGAITILCIIIWGFDWAEKREDELERKRILHAINFDAL